MAIERGDHARDPRDITPGEQLDRREFLRRGGVAAAGLTGMSALLTACGGSSASGDAGQKSVAVSKKPATITVWDYYGSSSPLKPALHSFRSRYPWIKVNYQELDWNTISTKFTVSVSSGASPDMATLDMTWIPTYASSGLLADLSKISGGMLNGKPVGHQFAPAQMQAMSYNGHLVTMLNDEDCYALYYRRDIFKKKGLRVPRNWTEFRAVAKKLAEDTNGDGKPDKYLMEIDPDTFHYASYLFQNGGSILNASNTKAAFNSPQGVQALQMYKGFLDDGTGIYWGPGQGDRIDGLNSGKIAMFEDGPYYMGIMKDGAKKLSGDWGIAIAPFSKKPGSYLGGTGLSIPVNASQKEAAWTFIQHLLKPQNAINVGTSSAGAPALQAALHSPQLHRPDPYYGGQDVWDVWLPTLKIATHYPYVKQWNDIDKAISDAVSAALLGKSSPKAALDAAAARVNSRLSQ